MTCRNVLNRCRNRVGRELLGIEDWRKPVYGPVGIRHEGGAILIQASVRNVGTCRSDAKGEAQANGLRKSESTNAGHRDGGVRSREEGPVMGLDRRDTVVQHCRGGNL